MLHADIRRMEPLTLRRWTRYGHDRVYAAGADGTRLGFVDLTTGEVTLEPGAGNAVDAALRAWRKVPTAESSTPADPMGVGAADVGDGSTLGSTAIESDGALPPSPAEDTAPEWTDLASNRPGEGVRAEADAAWAASKQRSKLFAYGARVLNVHTDERAWRVGADGEEAIGTRLNKLRDRGWHVLHSIPVGDRGSDIDHVLIGPGGVFTINSKNHPGGRIWVAKYQMRVNGTVVPYLRNARYEAERTSKLLSKAAGMDVPVRSCVVVLTGTIVPEVTIKQMPDDVMVLDRMDIPGWFKRRNGTLTADQVDAIFDVARRSTTWTSR